MEDEVEDDFGYAGDSEVLEAIALPVEKVVDIVVCGCEMTVVTYPYAFVDTTPEEVSLEKVRVAKKLGDTVDVAVTWVSSMLSRYI